MSPHKLDPSSHPHTQQPTKPKIWITGLASQYPPHLLTPDDLETLAARFYNTKSPGLRKVLTINRKTGISTRSSISTYASSFGTLPDPPTITDLDANFGATAVPLTVAACRTALSESRALPSSVTHTVAVTCTSQGAPGYDLLVAKELGLGPSVDRTLLHGVGCAGGLAVLRTAAQLACGAAARGKKAVVLGFACELCTPLLRSSLARAERSTAEEVGNEGALFSDGAAAFVVANELGMEGIGGKGLFEIGEWGLETIPGTEGEMGFYVEPDGYRTVLSRNIPGFTKKAVGPLFEKLVDEYAAGIGEGVMTPDDFDWALHPGGQAVVDGVKESMGLTEHQLRASREIYRTRGNSSSPTVLIVLDMLSRLERGKDHIVATSFGPGLSIEMVIMRRCRESENNTQPIIQKGRNGTKIATMAPVTSSGSSWQYSPLVLALFTASLCILCRGPRQIV